MKNHTPFPVAGSTDTQCLSQIVLQFFEDLVVRQASPQQPGRGRRPTLQVPHLLLSCLLMIIRGTFGMAEVHRSLLCETIGRFAPLKSFSRQAVRQRLLALGLQPFRELVIQVQEALSQRQPRTSALSLASFAPMVVAVDETKLDAVQRLCDETALLPQAWLLVGKLAAVFDVRRQSWLQVQFLSDPLGNGVLATALLLSGLPSGTLILADLGYFGYAWFLYLHQQGWFWVSRLKETASYEIVYLFYEQADLLDALVWLGTYRSDQYPHQVRLVQYRHGGQLYRSITNVTSPQVLPLAEIIRLYSRRWDSEMAFKLLKETLGLRIWWACEQVLVLQQLLLMLTLSQFLHAFQQEIAAEAHVEPLDVSMVILCQLLAHACWETPDGLACEVVRRARPFGIIRPSRYVVYEIPEIPLEQIKPPPPELIQVRPWKHTVRKKPRHPRKFDPFDFRFTPLLLI